jgi:hypothetical protein
MKILVILLLLSVVSIFIPHRGKKHNLSWHSRTLVTTTLVYFIGWLIYKMFSIF